MSSPVLASGMWSVLPTPFTGPRCDLDLGSLRRLTEGLSAKGILRGVLALGVFGESAQLTPEERRTVLRTVREAAAGLPMVVGITGTDTEACRESAVDLVGAAGGDACA